MKSDMYTTFANEYDDVIQDNIYNANLERPTLQSMLPKLVDLSVIDLGCGSGVYAQYLLAQGAAKVTCIDYAKEMVQLVAKKAEVAGLSNKVEAYAQDLSKGLPNEIDASADLVISPLMVHYLEDLNPLFIDIHRVLKAGGSFVFSTHHPFADFECSKSGNYFERELVQQEWGTVGKPVQVRFYRRSLTEITNALTKNGLVITQISEGEVDEKVKEMDGETYNYLSNNPNFIFIKCQKL
ncbi:class I SAM-dependent methyltransferase [Vibrio parahaemolyticus]|nr:methyltransferase domain-containing protein [Vibrio parahaemolyticus]EGQ8951845.1 methyltransferase domain-containing protein [Vibrio parahaemolyticus]EGQ8971658.1 methyltransferase domain-containing protein [Vibrio parahaemolyticus]EGR3506657.1 class I SAM-dependent methyltransferase [Vibrio parahaemolyticus]EGR3511826.1 class I SAM-dependent methyltransferase [Vibrio parahaemolyticus]